MSHHHQFGASGKNAEGDRRSKYQTHQSRYSHTSFFLALELVIRVFLTPTSAGIEPWAFESYKEIMESHITGSEKEPFYDLLHPNPASFSSSSPQPQASSTELVKQMDDLGFEKDIVLPSYNSQAQNPPTVIIFNVMHLSYVSFKLFSLLLISLVFLIWFPGCVFSWLCLFRKGFQCLWLFLYIFEVCIYS